MVRRLYLQRAWLLSSRLNGFKIGGALGGVGGVGVAMEMRI